MSDGPLSAAFNDAVALVNGVTSTEGPCAGDSVAEARATMVAVSNRVREEGALSSNESVDDINTEDLKYLLVEYYIGAVTQKRPGGGRERLANINTATDSLTAFLVDLDGRGLLPASEKAMSGIGEVDAPSLAPDKLRQAKIERFKADRADQRRMAEIVELEKRAEAVEAGAALAPVDEDVMREKVLLMIACAVRSAVDDLLSFKQELPILKHMVSMMPDAGGAGAGAGADPRVAKRAEAAEAEREASKAAAVAPDRPGLSVLRIEPGLVSKRETIKADVFKLDYRPPTMSLEEYAEKEAAEAEERSKRQAEAEADKPVSYKTLEEMGREDDEEEVDRSTLKDRNWDDWKEEIPRGIGNTKRV